MAIYTISLGVLEIEHFLANLIDLISHIIKPISLVLCFSHIVRQPVEPQLVIALDVQVFLLLLVILVHTFT